jgi:hypothetical protein
VVKKEMTLYLLNSPIFSFPRSDTEALFRVKRISLEEAKKVLEGRMFESAIGHDATAKALEILFKAWVPVNRVQVFFNVGDEALVFTLNKRLPEGEILSTVQEIEQVGYTLYYVKRLE